LNYYSDKRRGDSAMWLGISNYAPHFLTQADQFVNLHRELLVSLKGQRLREIYILWNLFDDEWCSLSPIVLITNKTQIELCANKINEYSLTQNTIEIDIEVEPSDMGDGEIWRYQWVRYNNFTCDTFITGVEVIELRYDTTVIHDQNEPRNVGYEFSNWLLHGLGIQTEKDYFSFYNAFDTNGIVKQREQKDFIRYTSL